MGNNNISALLKQLRKTSSYSANEVVEQLKKYNIEISAKTLYGYESGLSMLNADVFVALCKIYNCDNPMDIFGKPSFDVTEIKLLEKYRVLDSHGKEMVDFTLDKEYERIINEQTGKAPIKQHLLTWDSIKAAHNDHADEPDEQVKMQEDLNALKRPN